jgi:hypothetical protein
MASGAWHAGRTPGQGLRLAALRQGLSALRQGLSARRQRLSALRQRLTSG